MTCLLFLLQTTPPTSPAALAGLVLSGVAVLLTILQWLRRESREDGATVNQRLKKLEAKQAEHETRHTGHAQALQTAVDTLARDIKQVEKDSTSRCDALDKANARLPALEREMAALQAEIKRLQRIEEKLDRLTEMIIHRATD